jgi:hypothetical protein
MSGGVRRGASALAKAMAGHESWRRQLANQWLAGVAGRMLAIEKCNMYL